MKYLIYLLFFQTIALAQVKNFYADVEKTMQSIPENKKNTSKEIASYIIEKFTTENLQIKAAYYYVISTVSYDINHQFTVNLVISDDEMVSKTISSKKGVCIHYARFFKDIITQLGYNCQVISGYTKQNNSIAELSHAWCAMKLKDEKWYVFDPTWDSGYIQKDKFVRSLNSKYYKIMPSQSIKSHMPFDYLWQFLENPITEYDFINNIFTKEKNDSIDYDTIIKSYLTLSENEQLTDLKTRMVKTGIKTKLAKERFEILQKQLESYSINANLKELNAISNKYNEAIALLNDFINYRNAQFKPEKDDNSIIKMTTDPMLIFEDCNDKIYKIGFVGQDNLYELNKFKRAILGIIEDTKKQKKFVDEYIKANNRDRKKMFLVKK